MGQKLASQCPHHSLVHPNFLRVDREGRNKMIMIVVIITLK